MISRPAPAAVVLAGLLLASRTLAGGATNDDKACDAAPPWLQPLFDATAAATGEIAATLDTVQRQLDPDRLDSCVQAISNGVSNIIGERGVYAVSSYGLSFVTPDDASASIDALADPPARVVVLVHGLDDPGWMFDDLIPVLHGRSLVPARFEYPNDGPVAEAADLLAAGLRELRAAGVERIDIVGHSMGGLVARDVLTRDCYYDCDGVGNDVYPTVDRLIMVGTPNHGSQLAHLRGIAEMREQIVRALRGGGGLDRHLIDGNGEAAVDLLPGSDCLLELNQRALPQHTQYCIIAGRLSPIDEQRVERWTLDTLSFARGRNAPEWLRDFVQKEVAGGVAGLVGASSGFLGDGIVELDSTRLEDVEDFNIVAGNHMSILVRLNDDAPDPPAIPIILDRLERPSSGQGDD